MKAMKYLLKGIKEDIGPTLMTERLKVSEVSVLLPSYLQSEGRISRVFVQFLVLFLQGQKTSVKLHMEFQGSPWGGLRTKLKEPLVFIKTACYWHDRQTDK